MKIRSRWLSALAGHGLACVGRTLAATIRFRHSFADPSHDPLHPDCPRFFITPTWHDTLLLPIFLRTTIRQRTPANRMTTLVSQHRDGSVLTSVMRWFDLEMVRGSSRKGAVPALRTLLREVRDRHLCLTPDGPLGPRRIAAPGAVFLASQSGVPILPCNFMASSAWRIPGKWTDVVIPQPGSTIYCYYGDPIHVPADLTRDQIQTYRDQLQQQMDHQQHQVDAWARGELVLPYVRGLTGIESGPDLEQQSSRRAA